VNQNPVATRREWIGLGVIAFPCLLYAMDLSVLNLAVPALSQDLRPSASQLLWIIDIYGFLVAGSLITMGTLGDRIGRRKLLLIGAAAFGATSVMAAFSRSAGTLIAARALLGLAGATLAPSTLSLIRNMFLDPRERTVAISVWITSYSVGGAIGPLLGGVMLEHFWWGSVFLLAVPVMALLLAVGPRLLPEFRDPRAGRLDLLSAGLSLASVLLVIYGLKKFAEHGLNWPAAATIVAGFGVGALFLRRQRRLADPLIDLDLFRSRAFSGALVTYTLALLVAFGAYVFIAQYLQLVLGLTPLQAGLWTLPWSLGFVVGSLATPALVRRYPRELVMAAGMLLAALGFVVLTRVGSSSGLAPLVAASVLFSVGLAPAVTLVTDIVLAAAPPERAGAAAAISETSAELGGALGIAILGSVGTAVYRSAMTLGTPPGVPPAAAEAARSTLGGAVAAAARLPSAVAGPLLAAAREAFTRGFQLSAWISAGVTAGLSVLVWKLLGGGVSGAGKRNAPAEVRKPSSGAERAASG